MKNPTKNTYSRLTPSRCGLLVMLLALVLVGWGCDDNSKVITDSNHKTGTPDTGHGHQDDAGHGPDDDAPVIENGFMTGSWRVGRVEDQSLVVDLDTFQEKGSTEVSGYFTMSMLAGNGADSKSGDLLEGTTFDGETLIVKWNPTDVENELYTIEATRVDENTLTGTVSAAIYADFDAEVRITRYPAPPVGEDEQAGDIDAGQQGGAGGD